MWTLLKNLLKLTSQLEVSVQDYNQKKSIPLIPTWLEQTHNPQSSLQGKLLWNHEYECLLLLLLLSLFSRVQLCANPQTAAHQAPPSLGFSRQEHWSVLPFPSPMHENEKEKWSHSVVSDSQRPHGLQPTRPLRPWDFTDKSTGVG